MSVFFAQPRVGDLVFQLYAKPLHPELFDTVAVRVFQREDADFTVRLTRTGHVFSWRHPRLHLTELADVDHDIPESHRLLHYKMRGEHSAAYPCAPGLRYQVSFQVETLPAEIFQHVHDEILADGARRGILHHFQPHHRLSVGPLGFVTVESRPGCLVACAFHTFPDENTVVKSQSLFEIDAP